MEEGVRQQDDGHIVLPLPFKEDDVILPNNRAMAEKRLHGFKMKMICNEHYRKDYKTLMANLIEKGYAETIRNDSDEQPQGKV